MIPTLFTAFHSAAFYNEPRSLVLLGITLFALASFVRRHSVAAVTVPGAIGVAAGSATRAIDLAVAA